ncbi:MAG: hypothetical protein NWF07_08180 [Candidatus Bathyarchaeota archaeon]|nr:hypothetical protein [Candidatus Bathyarchaeota archaeon]
MSGVILSDYEKELLISLVEKGVERLEPRITPEGIKYNNLGESDHWRETINLLKSLEEREFLTGEDFDRAIICPSCDSPHVYSRYACPTERSIFIKKIILLRHEPDGYSGELETFVKNGRLVCPKCGKDLGSAQDKETWDPSLKEIGYSFQCDHNGHRFERPLVVHYCPVCGSTFDYRTARYIPLKAYTLSQKTYDVVKNTADTEKLIKPIVDFLKQNGLQIQYGYEIKGVSGSTHQFDLAATVGSSLLVIDYSFGDSQELVALLGKKLDIPSAEVSLIDFSDNEELLNLGKVYNIPIIDTGKKNWVTTLQKVVEKMKQVPVEKKETPRRRLWERRR